MLNSRRRGASLGASADAPRYQHSKGFPMNSRGRRVRVGTRRVRPATCTSATSGPPCWPGCSPAPPGGGSCSGTRTSTPSRVRPGVAERQRADLEALGLDFDPPVLVQSERSAAYEDALAAPGRTDVRVLLHPTRDRRGRLGAARRARPLPGNLPGPHRGGAGRAPPGAAGAALRIRAERRGRRSLTCSTAEVTGRSTTSWSPRGATAGCAYHLAVVVDDGASRVDQVVRGDDLLLRRRHPGLAGESARADGADVRARAAGPERRRARGWPSATARSPWPI